MRKHAFIVPVILLLMSAGAAAQTPNMEGYWNNQAGSAPWDIEPHPAAFQVPPGPGVIVDTPDRKIPYKPEALAKRNDLRDNHIFDDPQGHCAPSGVPRTCQTSLTNGLSVLER